MTRISPIAPGSLIPDPPQTRNQTRNQTSNQSRKSIDAQPRKVAADILERPHLYLVPKPSREVAPPSRTARIKRTLREHPLLVDAGFVAVTLGTATLLWYCGW